MKGKIRKTGEEITIVSYGGGIDRSDVLDYVSYIDSEGVGHPREKMNLYWDVEVVNTNEELAKTQLELTKAQVENARKTVETSAAAAEKQLTKREALAGTILAGLVAGIYASPGSCSGTKEDIVDSSVSLADLLLDRLKEGK